MLWLQDYLVRWPNTLLLVSHARHFLDAVATDIVHLHGRGLAVYKGDYSAFVRTSAERLANAHKAAESAAVRRAHVQAFIDKFRFNAKRASLVQSRIKALERMAEVWVLGVGGWGVGGVCACFFWLWGEGRGVCARASALLVIINTALLRTNKQIRCRSSSATPSMCLRSPTRAPACRRRSWASTTSTLDTPAARRCSKT